MNRRTFWKQVAAYGLSCLAFVPLVRNLRIMRERRTFWVGGRRGAIKLVRLDPWSKEAEEEVRSIREAIAKSIPGDVVLLTPGELRVPVRVARLTVEEKAKIARSIEEAYRNAAMGSTVLLRTDGTEVEPVRLTPPDKAIRFHA